MPVPYTFGTATAAIPLNQLDSNFATAITIGNTAVYLGNTTTSIGNLSLANVTITSVSTPITPAQGGTGLTSMTANSVVLGNATGSVLLVSPGTNGNVLVSNGTTWSSSTLANATGLSLTTGVTGILPVANGGSGTATPAIVAGSGVTVSGTWPNQTVAASGGGSGYTLGTPVNTTSGTTITFTGIPSGVKQIVISFSGVSTTGTLRKGIRLGDAGGIETSGYGGAAYSIVSTTIAGITNGAMFYINSQVAAQQLHGSVILTLENATSFRWAASGVLSEGTSNESVFLVSGTKALSQELTSVQILTDEATDTFDLGQVNIAYI